MNYVTENLHQDEQVVYESRKSGVLFIIPMVMLVLSLLYLMSGIPLANIFGWLFVLFSLLIMVVYGVQFATTKYVVTNRRAICKSGLLTKKLADQMLHKVESTVVTQGPFGRIFNYGTVTVSGTGGSQTVFTHINSPREFSQALKQ